MTTTDAHRATSTTNRGWYPVALVLVALAMGIEFAHVLELGPKLGYPPELYLQVNRSLYYWFGTAGAVVYMSSIVAVVVLAWRVRRSTALVAVSAGLLLTAFATWLTFVEPVNAVFRGLAPGEIPPDFTALRAQWEYGHAAGFVLFAAAFLLLIGAGRR